MKIKSLIILTLVVITIVSCVKKKTEQKQNTLNPTGKTYEYSIAKQPVLPDDVILNGMRINDTTNNLQVMLFPPQLAKKENTLNIKPIYQAFERIIKQVVEKSKAENKNNGKGKDKNFLYIQVLSLAESGDSLKCTMLIKEKLLSSDTLTYIDSISYPKK